MARKKKKKKNTPLLQKTAHTGFFNNRIITVTQSLAQRNDIFWFFLTLVLATVVYYYPDHGGDYDIWWHLRYGEQYISNGTWHIDHADFSWTPAASDWKYVTWLGSSILYLVYKAASFPGLYLLRFAMFAGVVLLFLRFLKHTKDSFDLTHVLGLFLLFIVINPIAIYIKPEMFSFFFFFILVYVYYTSKILSKNYFYLYPILFILWMNIHGAFVIGVFFMTVVLFLEIANYFIGTKAALRKKLLVRFAVYAVISYIVLILNPYGLSYIIDLFQELIYSEKVNNLLYIDAYINRWQYLFPSNFIFRRTYTAWSLVIMGLIALVIFISAYIRKRTFDISVIGINIGFFYFAMKMARASLFFPSIWLFSMIYVMRKADLLHLKKTILPVAVILLLVVASPCLYSSLTMNTYTSWFGLNVDDQVPKREVDFIIENKLPKPIFNDYLTGGYMIWSMYPEYKVFIDPRQQPYMTGVWDDFIQFMSNTGEESLKEIVSKYPCKTAMIHHISYGEIATAFVLSPDWQIVFLDTIAAVFVRTSELDSLNLDSIDTNLNADKFGGVSNPKVLMSLFGLYLSLNQEETKIILNIYKKNVSLLYYNRKNDITTMEMYI
ncbi:hypothetical protein ACFL30_01180 [Candidatus Latescibacterota bacterium]